MEKELCCFEFREVALGLTFFIYLQYWQRSLNSAKEVDG